MGANARLKLERSQAAAQCSQTQPLHTQPIQLQGSGPSCRTRAVQNRPALQRSSFAQLQVAESAPEALSAHQQPAHEVQPEHDPAHTSGQQQQWQQQQQAPGQRIVHDGGLHASSSAPGQLQGSAAKQPPDKNGDLDLTAVGSGRAGASAGRRQGSVCAADARQAAHQLAEAHAGRQAAQFLHQAAQRCVRLLGSLCQCTSVL